MRIPDPERSLVWVDRTGAAQLLALPPHAYQYPRLSPDGQRISFNTAGADRNVWLYDFLRRTQTRLTDGRNANSRPIWTPDGKHVVFGSAATGNENIFWKSADGSGAAERLTTSENLQQPSSWTPDGQTLAFVELHPTTGQDIWVVPLSGDRRPRPILTTRFHEQYPEFSPDGRWLAFTSTESGREEVYVQPYPGSGARQQISTDGGTHPAWSRDGRELFYLYTPTGALTGPSLSMMAVPIATSPTFTAGASHMLFKGPYHRIFAIRSYDVTPDGRRFLMVQPKDRPPLTPTIMILVQNWLEELKRRVPTK